MKLFIQEEKNLQLLLSSALVFVVCFVCLNLLNQSRFDLTRDSRLLPMVLNSAEPFLITGNIERLKPELEQLISGSNLERVDVHGADSILLATARNLNLIRPPESSIQEYSSTIVLDDALAATLVVQEYQTNVPQKFWPNILISFACALAAAIAGLFLNQLSTSQKQPHGENNLEDSAEPRDSQEEPFEQDISIPINKDPKGHQRMVLMIRLSDIKDQLVRTDDIDNYMHRVWRITERMAETYGISCIGVQPGILVFTASASNISVALRHCIMFGWNLTRQEDNKIAIPASLIASVDFIGENPCNALALATNEELLRLHERLANLNEGEFCVCTELQSSLPKSVAAIPSENSNLRVLSIETRMLDLWKQQIQIQH